MNHDALHYAVTDSPSDDKLATVDAGLEQHNYAVAPLNDVRPLAVFAMAASDVVVAGASGRTWGKCCELLQLWVAPEYRSQGVGSKLMQQFEARARARECTIFYLTTFSFQAPDFYRKHGYEVTAQITGYADDITKFLMQKTVI